MRRLIVALIGASRDFVQWAFWIVASTRRMLVARSAAARGEQRLSVHLSGNTPILIRDLLLWFNEWSSRHGGARDAVDLYIPPAVAFDNIGEIFTCVLLSPAAADTRFCWVNGADDVRMPICEGSRGSGHTPAGTAVLFERDTRPVDALQQFHECKRNVLQIPFSVETWARERLKQFHPGSFIVCAHWPAEMFSDSAARAAYCRSFFTQLLAEQPAGRCLVLDEFDEADSEWSADLANVMFTKRLGYSLLEELALVREADMYVGSYGCYAAILIGTDKPFVLLGTDPADTSTERPEPGRLVRAPHQVWIRAVPSVPELFVTVKDFYKQTVARDGRSAGVGAASLTN